MQVRYPGLVVCLVEAEASPGVCGFSPGERAFTNVFVRAGDSQAIAQLVTTALAELGFRLVRVHEVISCTAVLAKGRMPLEWHKRAAVAMTTGVAQYGSFHSWDEQG